jgi:hypothetical protein
MKPEIQHLYQTYLTQSEEAKVEDGIVIIPDISGYTNFVNNICVEAGRYITSQLLTAVLDVNALDMSVSEIEGDAILFYRFGAKPSVTQIIQQYESMLDSFKMYLIELSIMLGIPCNYR